MIKNKINFNNTYVNKDIYVFLKNIKKLKNKLIFNHYQLVSIGVLVDLSKLTVTFSRG